MANPYDLSDVAKVRKGRGRDMVAEYAAVRGMLQNQASKYEAQLAALREENARLKAEQDAMVEEAADELNASIKAALMDEMHDHALTAQERDELQDHERQTHERLGAILGTDDSLEECAKRAIRERDEARSAEAKARDESDLRDRLLMSIRSERDEARKQLTCIDLWLRRREPVVRESATLRSVQEFIERAEAEVKRLEGLILHAEDVRVATGSITIASGLEAEAQRIREREEGK